jgi:glyoxylase-like metal-dependent hydrolase (beta-lactamase superfamily II)
MDHTNEIKVTPVADGIYEIETYYLDREKYACCYLVEDSGEVAIIETNTNHAVPYILGALDKLGLQKNQVKYVMVTHIHLDHAGGTGLLMEHLPQAQLILHPRGRKHMINPEKLIKSVKEVYGEEQYKKLYGDIKPIPKERVTIADDEDSFGLGNRRLTAYQLAGHAKHHIILLDQKTGSIFSGDNFGIGYPTMIFGKTRLVFPSTSPTQFEPDKALESYEKIMALKPNRILLTHFGAIEDIVGGYVQLKNWIDFSVDIAQKRYDEGLRDKELTDALHADVWAQFEKEVTGARGTGLTPEEKELLKIDADLNSQGLAFYIKKKEEES